MTVKSDNNKNSAKSASGKKSAKNTKAWLKLGGGGVFILILGYIVMQLFAPYKGSMAYGICKVFIEMNVQFPTTMRINSVEEFSTSVRVWYTHTDSFGEYILEPVQCYYKPDATYGFILDRATIRRRDFSKDTVENFNKILPVIFAHPPDLTLPKPAKSSLKDLQKNIR